MISQEIFRYLLFPQLLHIRLYSHSHFFPFYECSLHPSSTSISHGARLLESFVTVAYCRQDAAVERQESEPGRVKQANSCCWHKKTLGHLPALGWWLNLRACFLTHADLCFLQSPQLHWSILFMIHDGSGAPGSRNGVPKMKPKRRDWRKTFCACLGCAQLDEELHEFLYSESTSVGG